MSVFTPFVAGVKLTAAALNAALSAIEAAIASATYTPPSPARCRGVRTSNISSIAANTPTRITGFTQMYDDGGIFAESTGIVTANHTGTWFVAAEAPVSSFSTAYRRSLVLEKNASGGAGTGTELSRCELESTDRVTLGLGGDFNLTSGDTLSVYVNLEATGSVAAASYPCWFTARWIP